MIVISTKAKVIVVLYVVLTLAFLFWFSIEINADHKYQLTNADKQYFQEYSNEIRFIGDEAYPPFSFVNNDTPSGYEADLISYLQQVLGVTMNYHQMNWSEAINLLEDGEHVVITGMKISEERKEKFLFTEPYLVTTQSLVLTNNLDIASLESLEDLVVIAQENSITHELAKKANPKAIILVREPIEGMRLLTDGSGDVWIENQMTALYYLRLHKQEQSFTINVLEETTGNYAMAASKDHQVLVNILNKAIYQLNQNGTIAMLDNKWFGIVIHRSYTETSVWFYLLILAQILLTVAFIFYLWNKTLYYQLTKRTEDLKKSNSLLHEERTNIQRLLEGIARSFSTAIDCKDDYTGNHSRRVTNISVLIANEMRLSKGEVFEAYIGALLHDIGKVGIPDNILKKEGSLTEKEYDAIKQHPVIGAKILSDITSYESIKDAVYYHHERWDGKTSEPYPAYPGIRRGEDIPLIARIISVADAYDAMTTDRPYRKGLSNKEAIVRIRLEAGHQFDPKVVECFLNIIERMDLDSLLQASVRHKELQFESLYNQAYYQKNLVEQSI